MQSSLPIVILHAHPLIFWPSQTTFDSAFLGVASMRSQGGTTETRERERERREKMALHVPTALIDYQTARSLT